jgi:hypothetical protein
MVVLSTTILEVIPNSEGVPSMKGGDGRGVTADGMTRNITVTTVVVNWHSARITNPPSCFGMANAKVRASINSHGSVDVARLTHADGSSRTETSVRLGLHAIEDSIISVSVSISIIVVGITSAIPPSSTTATITVSMRMSVRYSVDLMAMPAAHRNHRSVEVPLVIGVIAASSSFVRRSTSVIMPYPVPEAIQRTVAVSVESDVVDFASETCVIPPVAASSVVASTPVMHV